MLRRDFLHQSGMGLGIFIAMPKGVARWLNEAPLSLLWNNFLNLAQAQKHSLVSDDLSQLSAKHQALSGLSWYEAASDWHLFGRHQEQYAVQLVSLRHPTMGMIDFVAPIYSLQKNGQWAPLRILTAFDLEALLQLANAGFKAADLLPVASNTRFSEPARFATRRGSVALTTRIKDSCASVSVHVFDPEDGLKHGTEVKSER